MDKKELINKLRSENLTVVKKAIEEADLYTEDADIQGEVLKLLTRKELQEEVINFLFACPPDEQIANVIRQALKKDPENMQLIKMLQWQHTDENIPLLLDILPEDNWDVQFAIQKALMMHDSKAVLKHIARKLVSDPSEQLLELLATIVVGTPTGRELRQVLLDLASNEKLWHQAARVLGLSITDELPKLDALAKKDERSKIYVHLVKAYAGRDVVSNLIEDAYAIEKAKLLFIVGAIQRLQGLEKLKEHAAKKQNPRSKELVKMANKLQEQEREMMKRMKKIQKESEEALAELKESESNQNF